MRSTGAAPGRTDGLGRSTTGYAYRARIVIGEGGAIAPLAAPNEPVRVADLLP